MKLTAREQKALDQIKKHGQAYYMHNLGRFGGGYWWIEGVGNCTRQINGLIKKGYLTVKRDGDMGDKIATVKE